MARQLAALLVGLLVFQEPDAPWKKDLADRDPAVRRAAAAGLCRAAEWADDWLVREADKGTSKRQRAVLLGAALRGTDSALSVVELAARKGSRPSVPRAWGLLLYGAYHPDSVAHPAAALDRAASDFEVNCLLAGWLCQASRLPSDWPREELLASSDPVQRALAQVLDGLAHGRRASRTASVAELSAALWLATLPDHPPVSPDLVARAEGTLPDLWVGAARRDPGRELATVRGLPTGGSGAAAAWALYELPENDRLAAFRILDQRFFEARARSWLWGIAGDLGLALPDPADGRLEPFHVAGLLQLVLRDPAEGGAVAARWRGFARASLDLPGDLGASWPAAVVLALSPEPEDLARLRERAEPAEGDEAARVHPIWQLASGRLDDTPARSAWLRRWSRELGAGPHGLIDAEAGRWVAYLLVSGTRAESERTELVPSLPELVGARDHARDDELYSDLAEFLLSELYRWDLTGLAEG